MSDLASRIAAAMKTVGLNQPQLAKAASKPTAPVSQQVVQHLLSGRNKTSGHLPAIAEALGVGLDWLATGRGRRSGKQRAEALLIGRLGAGGEIDRLSVGPMLAGFEAPSGIEAPNVVEVGDDSHVPFQKGWLVFYEPEQKGISNDCLGKLCVIQIKDGPTVLKVLRPGRRKGLFRLESWCAPARTDLKITWAARVMDIRPC